MYQFLSVLLPSQNNHQIWDSDLSDDMCFVKIIKSFDSIRP